MNVNKNKTHQNWWDVVKAVYGRKYIALNVCVRKQCVKSIKTITGQYH